MSAADDLFADLMPGGTPQMSDRPSPADALFADLTPEKPKRNAFAVANDFMIDAGNASAGLLKAGVDLFAPGSAPSKAIKGFIESGQESQSDWKKAKRAELSTGLANADGELDKAGTYLKHAVTEDPLGTVAEIAGNIGPFGVVGRATQGLGMFGRTATAMGLSGGLTAGEVRGNIFERIEETPDSDLQASSPDYAKLRQTQGEAETKSQIGGSFSRHAPEILGAGAFGALGGKFGLEGMAARVAPARGRLANAAIGVADEASQGAVEQVATNFGLRRTLPDQPLLEDVALNAAAEGIVGLGGAAFSGRSAPQADAGADEVFAPAVPPADKPLFSSGDAPVLNTQALEAAGITPAPPAPVLNTAQLEQWGIDQPRSLKPSEAMGLNPAAGPLSNAAALAVDTGASPISPALGLHAGIDSRAPGQDSATVPSIETGNRSNFPDMAPSAGFGAFSALTTDQSPVPLENARRLVSLLDQQGSQFAVVPNADGTGFGIARAEALTPEQHGQIAHFQPAGLSWAPPESPASQATASSSPTSSPPAQTMTPDAGADQNPIKNGSDAPQAVGARWDSMDANARAAVLARQGGWATKSGFLNVVGKNLMAHGWETVPEKARARIERLMAQSEVTNGTSAGQNDASISGNRISREWTAFSQTSGTLSIPRAEMPQIKAEHRGAMVNFMNARGVTHEQATMDAGDLKPTQAEFSPAKVARAKRFDGGDRSILVSSDGYVLDGHHQWLAKREAGEQIKVIRLNAPIRDLVTLAREFPSSTNASGASALPAQSASPAKLKAAAVRKSRTEADAHAQRWSEMTLAEREALALSIGQPGIFALKTAQKRWDRLLEKVRESLAAKMSQTEGKPEIDTAAAQADNPPQGDPYEQIDTRAGSSSRQLRTGRGALRDLFGRINAHLRQGQNLEGRGSITLLGSGLYRGFTEQGGVSLIGQTVSSPADLASLAQVFRDPRFETFRVFYTAGNDVVGEAGYSSRLPAAVFVPQDLGQHIAKDLKAFGADGYFILHNHPSGRASPSPSDEGLTRSIAREVGGFRGHVVIDHNEYAVLDAQGRHELISAPELAAVDFHSHPELEHELLGSLVRLPRDVALLGKAMQIPSGHATVVLTRRNGAVQILADLPAAMLSDTSPAGLTKLKAATRRIARASGAGGNRFVVLPQDGQVTGFKHLVTNGIFRDVVSADGEALSARGDLFPGDFMDDRTRDAARLAEDEHGEVITLTGQELGQFGTDTAALRTTTIDWYQRKLQGTAVQHPSLGEIRFTKKGRDEVERFSADPEKLRLIPALRSLIEKGHHVRTEDPKHTRRDGIVRFHVIHAEAQLAQSALTVELLIGEDARGNLFYDLIKDPGPKTRNAPDGLPGAESKAIRGAGDVSASFTSSIGDDGLNIKIIARQAERPALTSESLKSAFAQQFPALAPTVVEMLERGRTGKRGGLVILEAGDANTVTRMLPDEATRGQALRSTNGRLQGLHDPKTGMTFLVAPNLTAETAPAVVLHEMIHSKQRADLDTKANALLNGRDRKLPALRAFLDRVAQRMADAGEAGSASEASAYIVEQAVLEGRQAGFSAADGRLLNWIEHNISNTVSRLVRDFMGMIRAWGIQHGRYPRDLAVDDLVAVARANMRDAARGRTSGQGSSRPLRSSRTSAVVADAASPYPVGASRGRLTPKEWITHQLANHRGWAMGALTRDQITDIWGESMPGVKRFDEVVRQMDTERQRNAELADQIIERWRKLPSDVADRVSDLMHRATLARFDPDTHKGLLPPGELKDIQTLWNTLPEPAKALYRDVRNTYADTLRAIRNGLADRAEQAGTNGARVAAQIRLEFDKYLQDGPYFPLARFGDLILIADKGDERMVETFESSAKRELRTRQLRAAGWMVKLTSKAQYSASKDGAAGHLIGEVLEKVSALDMPADQKSNLMDNLNQLAISTLPDASYRRHFRHRKGVPGFSSDAMRAFAASMQHAGHHIAKIRHAHELSILIDEMQKDIRDARGNVDTTEQQQVAAELTRRIDYLMNPNTHPVAAAAGQVGFVMSLGGSVASGLVNMTQTPFVTFPWLGAKFGFGNASAALTKASKDYFGGKWEKWSGFVMAGNAKLSADEQRAIRDLENQGLINLTQAHDLAGTANTDSTVSKRAFAVNRAMKIVGWTFHVPEVFNRQVSALASYRLARGAGQDHAAAVETARQALIRTHFDYSASNRARMMQGNFTRVITMFKQYSQQMTYLLWRNAYLSLKGESPEVKREARRMLVGVAAMHFSAAGTLGLPLGVFGITPLLGLLAMAMGDEDDPWDWEAEFRNMLADTFGTSAGEALARGPMRLLLNVDLAGRVGLGDLWWRAPNKEAEGRDLVEAWMLNLLGPVAGYAGQMGTAMQAFEEGKFGRGVESMMPKFVSSPLKAYRYSDEGVRSWRGDDLGVELTPGDVLGTALGFQPARLAEMYEGRAAIKGREAKLQARRQEIVNMWVSAQLAGDSDGAYDARDAIQRFNETNPEMRITIPTLHRSLRTKRRNAAQIENGAYLPASRDYLREQGRFANVE